jgi:hypothetical protein
MRHGKREGTDAPKPMPERQGNQNRAKQTDNANENGKSDTLAHEILEAHEESERIKANQAQLSGIAA